VPKDSKIAGITPEDLDGVTMGAQTSTTHANYAQEKLPGVEVKIYPSPDEYKLDLTNGRLDAAIDDVVVLDAWVKSPDGTCCKILGTLTPDPVIHGAGAGIAIRKEDTDLRDMFNKAIEEIRADGTYQKINEKYFPFDVYGS
jgi:polar amino acid transport system substrate-binding protein